MDIQKARAELEKLPEIKEALQFIDGFDGYKYHSINNHRSADWLNGALYAWQAVKAQAVPEGFVLISAEQLSQWGHMANYAEQYGCPECFEARGYAHSLACEINAYFNVSEAQEPANADTNS